jgi:hypothetical protein
MVPVDVIGFDGVALNPLPAVIDVIPLPGADGAQLADTANEAVVAKLAVLITPKNEPVNEPVTPVVAFTNALTNMFD